MYLTEVPRPRSGTWSQKAASSVILFVSKLSYLCSCSLAILPQLPRWLVAGNCLVLDYFLIWTSGIGGSPCLNVYLASSSLLALILIFFGTPTDSSNTWLSELGHSHSSLLISQNQVLPRVQPILASTINPDIYPDLDFRVPMPIQFHNQQLSMSPERHQSFPFLPIGWLETKDRRHFQTHIPCTIICSYGEGASVAYHQEVKSDHCCPRHLSIWVAKENTMQSGTRWSNILVTWRRDTASSASSVPHGHGYCVYKYAVISLQITI